MSPSHHLAPYQDASISLIKCHKTESVNKDSPMLWIKYAFIFFSILQQIFPQNTCKNWSLLKQISWHGRGFE